jgi:hypothetical protein
MKKFGTPNGAAPGNENEYVGFADDGTPPEPRRPPGFAPGVGGANPPVAPVLVPPDVDDL